MNFPRDFFAIGFANEWDKPERSFLEPEGLATMLRKLLLTLPAVGRKISGLSLIQGTMLISPEMGSFWTGHSARHTLPSWAAAAGVGKEDRDYLGRWSYAKHGSQDYVLTSRQVVHRIQRAVCKFILEGLPQPGLVEEELMERIKSFAVKVNAGPLTTARKHAVLVWTLGGSAWHLGGEFPLLDTGPVAAPLRRPWRLHLKPSRLSPRIQMFCQRHHTLSRFAERRISDVSMFQNRVQYVRSAAW